MKKKLLGLISVVLSLCMLCACNSGLSLNDGYEEVPTFTAVSTPVALFNEDAIVSVDYNGRSADGKYLLFENSNAEVGEDMLILYNVVTGSKVTSWKQFDTEAPVQRCGHFN